MDRRLPALVARDLRQRWSGGGLAWGWAVLQPLAQIAIFTVVFATILAPRGGSFADPRAYVVYLCVGFFPWLAVSDGLVRGTASLLEGAGMLRRTRLPLYLFPAKAVLAAWSLCAVALVLVLVAAPALGCVPRAAWALLPLPLLSLVLVSIGTAMVLAPLCILARDVGQGLALLLPLVLWSAPVIYVPEVLPPWAQRAQAFHPLAPALTAIHGLVLDGALPSRRIWLLLLAYPGLAMVAGWFALRFLDSEVRDAL